MIPLFYTPWYIRSRHHLTATNTPLTVINVGLPISTRHLDTRALSTVANTVSLTASHDQGLQTPGTLRSLSAINTINPVPLPRVN